MKNLSDHMRKAFVEQPRAAAPRIRWDVECPAEVVAAVEPFLREFAPLVPGWCHELRCGWDANDSESAMWTSVNVEYRWTRIQTCPGFLSVESDTRRAMVLHEIVHIHVQPLSNLVTDLLDAMDGVPEPLKKWAREQRRMTLEGAVCDLTAALLLVADRPRE